MQQRDHVRALNATVIHARTLAASRQHEENGARFNYKANGFMYANVRVFRRDADLITAAAPAA